MPHPKHHNHHKRHHKSRHKSHQKLALLEHLHTLLESKQLDSTRQTLNHLHPSEIARLIESFPAGRREVLWQLLDHNVEGAVLLKLSDDVRSELIAATDAKELTRALKHMEKDDLADLFSDLPHKVTESILQQLEQKDRLRLEQVISYAEKTAGSLMNTDTVSITENITVNIALRYLRMLGTLPQHTNRLIVVDYTNQYLGTVLVNQLITSPTETLIKDLMDDEVAPLQVHDSIDLVVDYFNDYKLISAPVVDAAGTLLGRITIDDVLGLVHDEARQAKFEAAGLSDESLFGSIPSALRKRSLWLSINLATALIASWVINLFDNTLEQIITLAVLIPVVASMGGIAGNQTMTLLIRGIATDQVGPSNFIILLIKELRTGLASSLLWGVAVAGVTVLWFQNWALGAIICVATIANIFLAVLAGFYIPFILKKLNIDPAIAGNVILTTLTDALGIFIFLGLATIILL